MAKAPALAFLLMAACTQAEAPRTPFEPSLEAEHIERAASWLDAHGLDRTQLLALPPLERAKVATSLAYRFCSPGSFDGADLLPLYDICATQCGGYAFVFAGLAEAMELRTRPVYLHNVPLQGSHVATEVMIDGEWAFFDPTYGAFFTAGDRALSMAEVVGLSEAELGAAVRQASKGELGEAVSDPYSGSFNHAFMRLDGYTQAEAVTYGDPSESLALSIPLHLSNGALSVGAVGATTRDDLAKGWLDYTNQTQLDGNPATNTAYSSYLLYNGDAQRSAVVELNGLSPGSVYSIELVLHNPISLTQSLAVQIGTDSQQFVVSSGVSQVRLSVPASAASEAITVTNASDDVLEMFAIQVMVEGA